MNTKQLTLIALALAIPFFLFSQSSKYEIANSFKVKKFDRTDLTADNYYQTLGSEMKLSESDKFILEKQTVSKSGSTHNRYKQFYKGIEVFGSSYILHQKNGVVYSSNGRYLPRLEVDVSPNISENEAIKIAIRNSEQSNFSWEKDASKNPLIKLCIVDASFISVSNQQLLAYKITLDSYDPREKFAYFIDAHSGQFIEKIPLIHCNSVPAKGVSRYYGEQEIMVDSIAPNRYVLRDLERGITTFSATFELFEDEDNFWDYRETFKGEAVFDAHWCTARFHDMMLEQFEWEGVDNNGMAMQPVVYFDDPDGNFVNAFWDGSNAYFGNGDCNYGPLTTLDVVGHEFMHGITQNTAELIYANESGAINESMSDVFGKAIEYFEDPANFSWYVGDDFVESILGRPFRNMADPSEFGHPDFYKGGWWRDEAGVHTNSSVGNNWFYTLVEGETGENEFGQSYSVAGIGMEKAMHIAFETLRDYMTPNTDYPEFYDLSLLVSADLFGENSLEYNEVVEAWKSVGLPYVPQGNITNDLQISLKVDRFACVIDGYFPVVVEIQNFGNSTYNINENRSFILSTFEDEVERPILDNILPGETITYIVDDVFYFTGGDIAFFECELSGVDENNDNNYYYTYVLNASSEQPTMEVFETKMNISCFKDNISSKITFRNNGCETLPAGANITTTIRRKSTDEIVHIASQQFKNDTYSFNSSSISFEFEDSKGIDEAYQFEFEITHSESNFSEAKMKSMTPDWATQSISGAYENDFEGPVLLEKMGRLYMNGTAPMSFYLQNFSGNNTSIATAGSQFDRAYCETEYFDGTLQNSVNAMVVACLDYVGLPQHELTFDLTQYRNDQIEAPYSVIDGSQFRISFSGTHEFERIIKNAPEGELINYSELIPMDFKGTLKMEFMNRTGNSVFSDDFFEKDVMLMDNFKILPTPNPNPSTDIFLFPNPANQVLNIRSRQPIERVDIYDAQGRNLGHKFIDAQHAEVDVSDYPEGVYFANALLVDGSSVSRSFVKME